MARSNGFRHVASLEVESDDELRKRIRYVAGPNAAPLMHNNQRVEGALLDRMAAAHGLKRRRCEPEAQNVVAAFDLGDVDAAWCSITWCAK